MAWNGRVPCAAAKWANAPAVPVGHSQSLNTDRVVHSTVWVQPAASSVSIANMSVSPGCFGNTVAGFVQIQMPHRSTSPPQVSGSVRVSPQAPFRHVVRKTIAVPQQVVDRSASPQHFGGSIRVSPHLPIVQVARKMSAPQEVIEGSTPWRRYRGNIPVSQCRRNCPADVW